MSLKDCATVLAVLAVLLFHNPAQAQDTYHWLVSPLPGQALQLLPAGSGPTSCAGKAKAAVRAAFPRVTDLTKVANYKCSQHFADGAPSVQICEVRYTDKGGNKKTLFNMAWDANRPPKITADGLDHVLTHRAVNVLDAASLPLNQTLAVDCMGVADFGIVVTFEFKKISGQVGWTTNTLKAGTSDQAIADANAGTFTRKALCNEIGNCK